MPREKVGAQVLKLLKGELGSKGFLDGYNVNMFIPDVLDELATTTIMAEAAEVPEKGPHLNPHRGAA